MIFYALPKIENHTISFHFKYTRNVYIYDSYNAWVMTYKYEFGNNWKQTVE